MIDHRISLYLPFYLGGLIIGPDNLLKILHKKLSFFFFLVSIGFILILCYKYHVYNSLLPIGSFCLLYVSYIIAKMTKSAFVNFITLSSMCAYMFHRQIYGFFYINNIPVYAAIIVIFVVSYAIQEWYNKMISLK